MQQQPQRRPKKSSGFNWIGLLIFLVFAIGPQILRVVRNLFGGLSLTLPASIPGPLIIFGVIVLAVVVSGAFRAVRAAQRGSEMRPPTTVIPPQSLNTPPIDVRRSSAPMPPFGGTGMPFPTTIPPSLPNQTSSTPLPRPQQLPSAPRFEPIITGKAVVASLGMVLLFGLVYALARVLS